MSEGSEKIERIVNEKLIELMGKIRVDSSGTKSKEKKLIVT